MDDPELRRRRSVRIVLTRSILELHGAAERARELFASRREIRVVGTPAVSAPVTLVRTTRRIEHDHPVIDVAIGDVELIRGAIDGDARGATEVCQIVAAVVLAAPPNLHQKSAVASELQNLGVLRSSTADPDRVAINQDAVFELRPLVSGTRP